MPRIFATDQAYNSNMGETDFVNGAAELAATETEAIALFTAAGFTVDTSKNALTVFDTLTRAQLNLISSYLGVALVAGDTKAQLIRKIETPLAAYLVSTAPYQLGVASAHGTDIGDTLITVTPPSPRLGTVYKYKTHASTAPAVLIRDVIDDTWTTFTSATDLVVTDTHKIAVVDVDANGVILGYGSVTADTKTS